MKKEKTTIEAFQMYATAHAAHYKTKDLQKAITLYEDVLKAHPHTKEAVYSRTQIQNIAKSVVPQQELFESQNALAQAHLALTEATNDDEPALVTPDESKLPG